MKEVVEMACMLLEMGTDTYMKSKYALLAANSKHPADRAFFDVLFDCIDKKRPLLITDKKEGRHNGRAETDFRNGDYQ